MAITSISRDWSGSPSIVRLSTTDTLATATGDGYLTDQEANIIAIQNGEFEWILGDMVAVFASDGNNIYQFDGDDFTTLINLPVSTGTVTVELPVTANHIAMFVDTAGTIGDTSGTAIHFGYIQAGGSGVVGGIYSYPTEASKGKLIFQATANTGNTDVTLTNSAHGQATVYSIPDILASTGYVVVSTTPARVKYVAAAAAAGGAAAQSFTDAFCTTGSVVVGNWVTQANAASVLKIVPGNGSFVVTSSADAGVGTFSYSIVK